MPSPEIVTAGLAAVAVLLLTYGLAGRAPKDAVQQRLEQLVVQPKTLEEFELQQPFFERVMRPLVKRLSKVVRRGDQGGIVERTDAKLERAGYPGGLRGADWMGVKILMTILFAVVIGLLMLVTGRVPLDSWPPSSGSAAASAHGPSRWSCNCPTRSTCSPSQSRRGSGSTPPWPRWWRRWRGHSSTSSARRWPRGAWGAPGVTRRATLPLRRVA